MAETSLQEKINNLFRYRKFHLLYEMIGKEMSDCPQMPHLLRLQETIYLLDQYLENNWAIEDSALNLYWSDISVALDPLGIDTSQKEKLLEHIKVYQRHELYLRQGRLPYSLDPEYYYHYKSCDVRLIRKLIYLQYPALIKLIPLSYWRYFDIITEINDDVADFEEDLYNINGNYYLLATEKDGLVKTRMFFEKLMKKTERKSRARLNRYGEKYRPIHDWHIEEVKQTKILLNDHQLKRELMEDQVKLNAVRKHLSGTPQSAI